MGNIRSKKCLECKHHVWHVMNLFKTKHFNEIKNKNKFLGFFAARNQTYTLKNNHRANTRTQGLKIIIDHKKCISNKEQTKNTEIIISQKDCVYPHTKEGTMNIIKIRLQISIIKWLFVLRGEKILNIKIL